MLSVSETLMNHLMCPIYILTCASAFHCANLHEHGTLAFGNISKDQKGFLDECHSEEGQSDGMWLK